MSNVPVQGWAGKRTSSWYDIDQRLICQGVRKFVKGATMGQPVWTVVVGTRQKEEKKPGRCGRCRTLGV
jgi:hypothetical protein